MNELKKETEKKVLDAAREVFIEKGLNGARMQEIADRAGINKALLHYYYRSKELLFDAVFEEIARDMFSQFSEKLPIHEEPSSDFIKTFALFYNQYFKDNQHVPQFFFHEIWQHPDKLAAYIKSHEINPPELIDSSLDGIGGMPFKYTKQHMAANLMGMCLFPYIARPLFQRVFFNNDEGEYDCFLEERNGFLETFIDIIFSINNSNSEIDEPDEAF